MTIKEYVKYDKNYTKVQNLFRVVIESKDFARN